MTWTVGARYQMVEPGHDQTGHHRHHVHLVRGRRRQTLLVGHDLGGREQAVSGRCWHLGWL